MPFPFKPAPDDKAAPADDAPQFAKKGKKGVSRRGKKTGKVAPAQKALMSGRSMSGGRR